MITKIGIKEYEYPVSDNIATVASNANLIAKWLLNNWGGKSKYGDAPKYQIACRGQSGVLIAGFINYWLQEIEKIQVPIIVIRKDTEASHGGTSMYPHLVGDKIIVVDDFVSTGSTMMAIAKRLDKADRLHDVKAVCICNILQNADRSDLNRHFPNLQTILV